MYVRKSRRDAILIANSPKNYYLCSVMSDFIVSARKYRPATFSSVVGQQSITSTLKNAIERGQLAHAYLFCGPRGVGKTTCARIFAKAINCQHPHGAEACNECESCRAFNEGRSLNIHELDAASNNSVDDIRSLIDQVRILPQVGKYSVFIIDEVHMLSQQAFNAFLKTLEEPPKHAIFILATTEKHKILPTILSRCQVYDFNRIRVEDAVGYLKHIADTEGVTYDEESLNLIAQKADGGMRDALSMFDKAVSFCSGRLDYKDVAKTLNVLDYDTYFSMTDMLLAGDYVKALMLFDEVLSKGFSGQTFMAGLNEHMRDLLLAKGPAASLIELTGTLLERYRSQAGRCDEHFLFGAINILTDADGRIRQSSNRRLLVELGLMKIAGLGKKKNDDDPFIEDESYSLPDLPDKITPAASGDAVARDNRVVPQATSVSAASAQPAQPAPSAQASPVSAASAPTGAQTVQAGGVGGSVVQPQQQSQTQAAAVASQAPRARHSAVSGMSIASLMSSAAAPSAAPVVDKKDNDKGAAVTDVDPESESKIERCRDRIIHDISEERPRFVVAFESMRVAGNVITVEVPSSTLCEEILRAKTEILLFVARTAGVMGRLDLKVRVNEAVKASRPIKLEDRIRYMTEKNAALLELKKALDMEYE